MARLLRCNYRCEPIRLYTTRWCGYCVRAKALLDRAGSRTRRSRSTTTRRSGRSCFELTGGWTVPQIVIDDEPIGGYTELWRLDRDGRLDEKLAA